MQFRDIWLRIAPLTCALLLGVVLIPLAHAASVVVVNKNAAGVGFNDPTPAAPVGGNTGATLGAQRLIAFQAAADIWGALVSSPVPIRVGAQFVPLSCNTTSAVLGSAGPVNAYRDFVGVPVAGTWYASALANALAKTDLDGAQDDINASFNSNLGAAGCLPTSGWYYGLDSNTPAGSGGVAMWLMNGATVLQSASIANAPVAWSIAGTGDFNGDGKSDMLWRHTSGSVAVWLMNGVAVLQTANLGNAPTDWSIEGVNAD